MARTDLGSTRLLGYTELNQDAVTGLLLGLMGTRPTVRHISSVTDEILEFLTRGGLQIEEDMHVFRQGSEALAAAEKIVADGYRLISPYPLPEAEFSESAALVPPPLWRRLNAKQFLGDLVPERHLPKRRVLGPGTPAEGIGLPVVLKAGGGEATGWGYAVRLCQTVDEAADALAWFREQGAGDTIVAEEYLSVGRSWCAHVACSDKSTQYLGAIEQVFAGFARQAGSVMDPNHLLPEDGVGAIEAAGETARSFGFRGVAALDIGRTEDGRYVVFDPNFRVNASTTQLLFHHAATEGTAWSVSHSLNTVSPLPMAEIIARLSGPAAEGWFAPTRLLDAAHLPAAGGASLCTGFTLGATREDAETRAAGLVAAMQET
ncbi:MAG: hypothetical protein AAFR35_07195 [Pseudomonadota bacterium]